MTPQFDLTESVAGEFRSGRGAVTLRMDMSDRELVSLVRLAMAVSAGQPFTVITPARGVTPAVPLHHRSSRADDKTD